jgi:hypothetical protein
MFERSHSKVSASPGAPIDQWRNRRKHSGDEETDRGGCRFAPAEVFDCSAPLLQTRSRKILVSRSHNALDFVMERADKIHLLQVLSRLKLFGKPCESRWYANEKDLVALQQPERINPAGSCFQQHHTRIISDIRIESVDGLIDPRSDI